MNRVEFEALVGETLTHVREEPERLTFQCASGRVFTQYHESDCCESVSIAQTDGDWATLTGFPISVADESTREASTDECSESGTWSFYTLATPRGTVSWRWLGESNGYYSETVDLYEVDT